MTRRRRALTAVAIASAGFSGAALLVHAAGFLPLYFLINVLGPLSLVLLLATGALARRLREDVFLDRLVTGAWAGLVATFAYDLIRALLRVSGAIDFDPFRSHPAFGTMITRRPESDPLAVGVGWLFHFWNGFGFGILYTLVAGRSAWWYGLVWALMLEIAWLTALPSAIGLRLHPPYVVVSIVGHGAYGVVLGLLSARFVRA